jgi:hypothetical protein
MTDKSVPNIVCPICGNKSTRVGAQDYCDVYVCEIDSTHLTRIKVGAVRTEWNELASVNNGPTQGT